VRFTGKVKVPADGRWEVGLVQNLHLCRHEQRYSRGGVILFHTYDSWLDILDEHKDIWFDTTGNGVQGRTVIEKATAGATYDFTFECFDTPNRIPPIPAFRTRCDGTITERLLYAKESTAFRLAVVARMGDSLTQMAVTKPYGYDWTFDVANLMSAADSSWLTWKAFLPSGPLLMPPFNESQPMLRSLRMSGSPANKVVNDLNAMSEADYLTLCHDESASH
jgi:hypothetical protein